MRSNGPRAQQGIRDGLKSPYYKGAQKTRKAPPKKKPKGDEHGGGGRN